MVEAGLSATVLVVDDERGPRESLRMILSPQHDVLQAENASEALAILRERDVDLVTLDLNMPGMKGDDLMRVVRGEFPQTEVVVISGCGNVETAAEGIRCGIADYLEKPFDTVQVSSSVERALGRQRARRRLRSFLDELGTLVGRNREVDAILHDVRRSEGLCEVLSGVMRPGSATPNAAPTTLDLFHVSPFLEVLAETIETKAPFMRGHARRVAFYAGLLADRLGLSSEDQEHIRVGAFLHDLGKVGLPTDLLLRDGALDGVQRAAMERHPEVGARMLRPLELPGAILAAIRHHHEWWDGTGYPHGLAGGQIPVPGRVVAIADAFDAMTSDRPYRRALPREVVIIELSRYAGLQFDPELTREFLAVLEHVVCDVEPEFLEEGAAQAAGPVATAG